MLAAAAGAYMALTGLAGLLFTRNHHPKDSK
jgi:hypothetical protein